MKAENIWPVVSPIHFSKLHTYRHQMTTPQEKDWDEVISEFIRIGYIQASDDKDTQADKATEAIALYGLKNHGLPSNVTEVLDMLLRKRVGCALDYPRPQPSREMVSVEPVKYARQKPTLKVVSYNVLADCYATKERYPYCPSWALEWEQRGPRLIEEILGYDADVVCLQEVQASHWETFFLPRMQQGGYEGFYLRKTKKADGDDQGKMDGCATFYRRSRFRVVERYDIEYDEFARVDSSSQPNQDRVSKGNVAQVLTLEDLLRTRRDHVCVVNTHLFWDPARADVKLWQVHALLKALERDPSLPGRDDPLLICGDFNSMPGSPVYEYVTRNRVPFARDDPYSLLPPRNESHGGRLAHLLRMASAYAVKGEPKFTTYTPGFSGCLDYVFFTKWNLRVVSLLQMPSEDAVREYTAMPSPVYPSDHAALVVELRYSSMCGH
jgi:CCR4-NOT transcription complex subunit 6